MGQAMMTQKQKTLAEAAQANPEHRFTNLYSLMHWDYWIRTAMDTVLARPGSTTAGIDGKARDYFKDHYEETGVFCISPEGVYFSNTTRSLRRLPQPNLLMFHNL